MGDIITLLEHLSLSPVNSALLAVIIWLVYRLFQKFDALEGTCGIIQQIRDELADHDTAIEILKERTADLKEDLKDRHE